MSATAKTASKPSWPDNLCADLALEVSPGDATVLLADWLMAFASEIRPPILLYAH
jgi:hypothetical protein